MARETAERELHRAQEAEKSVTAKVVEDNASAKKTVAERMDAEETAAELAMAEREAAESAAAANAAAEKAAAEKAAWLSLDRTHGAYPGHAGRTQHTRSKTAHAGCTPE